MATETGSNSVDCYTCDAAPSFPAGRTLPRPEHRISRAFLDGEMGYAVVCERSAAIIVGDFLETLGPVSVPVAGEVLRRTERRRRSGEALHMFEPTPRWKQCFADLTDAADLTTYRRLDFGGLTPQHTVLQKESASGPRSLLGDQEWNWFDIIAIDEAIADRISAIQWAADAVANFGPPSSFVQRGFGFAAATAGRIIGVVGCFTAYSDGVEVQIDTHRDFRGRGVASALGRRFLQEAAVRNATVYWDAMNEPSARLAGRLGFGRPVPYHCLIVP